MMKRFTLLFVLCVLAPVWGCGLLQAQQVPTSKSLIKSFAQKVEAAPAMEARFAAEDLEGVLVLQGRAFRLTTADYEVYCDGQNRWTYNKEVEEVVLVPHDSLSMDLLENPLAFLLTENKSYQLPARPASVQYQGEACWQMTLTPVQSSATYSFVTLLLTQGDLSPRAVACGLKDGTQVTLGLSGFQEVAAREPAYFVFSPQAHPRAYVVDLR